MRNIILATAFVLTVSGTAQANIIVDEFTKTKLDFDQKMEEGREQLSRNKEELKGYFIKIKGFVINAVDKIEGLNNEQ